jgi:hypothetical protein
MGDNMFKNKYRVKILKGYNMPFTPQIKRWYFPFWTALSHSYGEGGSWWDTAYETSDKAWDAIQNHKLGNSYEQPSYIYTKP